MTASAPPVPSPYLSIFDRSDADRQRVEPVPKPAQLSLDDAIRQQDSESADRQAAPAGSLEWRFWQYHEANPQVYEDLKRLSLATLRRLKALYPAEPEKWHYGIGSLAEVVRWHRSIRIADAGGFKINNSFRSRYSRLIEARVPSLKGFFEFRILRTDSELWDDRSKRDARADGERAESDG